MNRTNITVSALALVALGAIGAGWFLGGSGDGNDAPATAPATARNMAATATPPAAPTRAPDIAAGKVIYGDNCASCHGANLEGQPNWQEQKPDGTYPAPPHDETGHTWHHDDKMLFGYIRDGGAATLAAQGVTSLKSGMPAFGDILTDDEIRDVLAYIESTWPERIREARRKRGTE